MNRQMYNMGGSSLQTGAPDITLTGDMRPTYSAMRKQRLAGGGIASMRDRIKYDVKPGETLVGKLLLYNATKSQFRTLKVRRDPACPVCGDNPSITELIDYEFFCGLKEESTV